MPKEVWKISKFEGGLNDYTDPKDIKSKEFVEAQDVSVSKIGQIKNLGKPTLNTSVPSTIINYAFTSGIIKGAGLHRMVNDYSLGPPQDLDAAATVTITNTTPAFDGTKSSATFTVHNLLWVADDLITPSGSIPDGDGKFQLILGSGGGAVNLHTATEIVDFTPLDANFLDDETTIIDGETIVSLESSLAFWIDDATEVILGTSTATVFGNSSYSAWGFYKYSIPAIPFDITLPYREVVVNGNSYMDVEYSLRRASFIKKLVELINADTVADAVDLSGGRIKITAPSVGTALEGKQINGTISSTGLANVTLVTTPSIGLSQPTADYHDNPGGGGTFTISGETELSGGEPTATDLWTITIAGDDNNGDRIHVSVFMNSGSGQQGELSESPFVFSNTATALATDIRTAINSVSGIASGGSGTSITATADSPGTAAGFQIQITAHNNDEPIFEYSNEDEQHYFINKKASAMPDYGFTGDGSDIYGNPLLGADGLYPSLNALTNIMGVGMSVFSSMTGSWSNVGNYAGTNTIWNDLDIGTDYSGNFTWVWHNNLESPNPIFFHNRNIVRMADSNFNLPNYTHFAGYIDNSGFFPDYKDADGTEYTTGYADLYSSLNKWWLYDNNKRWSFTNNSSLNPKYAWSDSSLMGLRVDGYTHRYQSGDGGVVFSYSSYHSNIPDNLLEDAKAGMEIAFWQDSVIGHPDANWTGTIRLYAAAVYNDGSESLPTHQFELSQGSNEFTFTEPSNEANNAVFPLISVHLRMMQGAIDGNTEATGEFCFPDPRVTGIRLYYTHSDDSYALYYSMGLIDFVRGWVTEDGGSNVGDDEEAEPFLLHPTGGLYKWTGVNIDNLIDSQYEESDLLPFVGTMKLYNPKGTEGTGKHNVIPGLTMPKLRTYEMINGYDPIETTTISLRYKAAALAGQRLFVGNIEVVENGIKRYYNDRVVYTPVNKLDTFPYPTNVLDVDISDGDEIVALASVGGKILQWKRRMLYIVDINSGMPDTFFVSDRFKNRGLIDKNHWCDTTDGIFWFNEFGAWLYDGEEIIDIIVDEEEDIEQRRIDPTTWSDFVTSESMCGFNPLSREVVILKKDSQSSTASDGDCYVYSLITNSWVFGSERAHIGHAANTKELTNITNIGTLHQLGFLHEVSEQQTVAKLSTWEYKGQYTENFKIVTKITNLGSPEAKKSILGLIINTIQETTESVYTLHIEWRGSINGRYRTLTNISNTHDSTDGQLTNVALEHRHMFAPPIVKGITRIQLRITGTIAGDFGINDISLIYRKYRESLTSVLDED